MSRLRTLHVHLLRSFEKAAQYTVLRLLLIVPLGVFFTSGWMLVRGVLTERSLSLETDTDTDSVTPSLCTPSGCSDFDI